MRNETGLGVPQLLTKGERRETQREGDKEKENTNRQTKTKPTKHTFLHKRKKVTNSLTLIPSVTAGLRARKS